MSLLRLTERSSGNGCVEIIVEGEIDLDVADQLDLALERTSSRYRQVLIDLHECEFIDSTGISVILRAHDRMAAEGRRVVVFGLKKQVHRVFSMTGLTENGLVFDSLDEALSGA